MRFARIALLLLLAPACWPQQAMDAKDAFDHVILGTADLDAGIRFIQERTGVRAMVGGSHPGRGTRNALVSLGGRHYLEIMAPDPAQHVEDTRGLRKLTAPRLIGWVVATEDAAALGRRAVDAGIKTNGPEAMSRRRPDGRELRWQMLTIGTAVPLIPGFIQWAADATHPSQDAPPAGTVEALTFEMPNPAEFASLLQKLGINAQAKRGEEPRIVLTLKTPKGRIELR